MCQGDIEGLMRECAVYVQRPGPKVNPSTACCGVVKRSDVHCACDRPYHSFSPENDRHG